LHISLKRSVNCAVQAKAAVQLIRLRNFPQENGQKTKVPP